MNANRSKLIKRAAFKAIETVTHCRTVKGYKRWFTDEAKMMFRYYYSGFRGAVNGTTPSGAFLYRRDIETLD